MGATTASGIYAARELKLWISRGQRRVSSGTAMLLWLTVCVSFPLSGQTVFLDFNTVGQYTNNFNAWNDSGGVNGSNFSFMEDSTAGVGGSRGVSVFQSTDTTAAYKSGSWDFSTNGATLVLSALVKANGQSGNKVQLGIMNNDANGLNNNTGVAFESFRFIPSDSTTWSLREQTRSANTLTELVLGNVTVVVGHWYKFVVSLTNTAGVLGNYDAGCAIYDYGTDGLTPGGNIVGFSTLQSHVAQTDIAGVAALWPALRAFQNGGIDAWDNFLVYQTDSPPVITLGLTNSTVLIGHTATFKALADGPWTISYAWYTNGILASGATAPTYTTPPAGNNLSNLMVVANNANGSASNLATVTLITPTLAAVTNLPATSVQATAATLNGQVLSTGGDPPFVTIFYGLTNGGTNAAAWAQSSSLGAESGAFAQTVTGLSPGTNSYFTTRAVNAAGTAWAAPSQSFTTLGSDPISLAVAVLTHHNDNARTGANLNEQVLNITNVNTNQFGLVFTRLVDDQIYAQPLVMTNVNIPGKGTHNVVIVVTLNDSVYAFDADDPSVSSAYWQTNFLGPNVVAVAAADMTGACGGGYKDFSGNIGIVSTPVIDPASGTIYLVARTKEFGTNFVQRLHALDIRTGAERPNSPVIITAKYPGTGDGSSGGFITFDSQKENQRSGLALVNGIVYIAWASHCDWGPYHGWVMGYDASTMQRSVVYNDTPNGGAAGIWMSGQPPSADTNGNLYISTGNGTVGTTANRRDTINRGESLLKFTRNGTNFTIASWFTPYNFTNLENGDIDLGSAGLLLIPGTNLTLSGGKEGRMYLVNRDNMGGLSGSTTADTNIVQSFFPTVSGAQLHGGPVWWDGPDGSYAYLQVAADFLRQYKFDRASGTFLMPNYARSPTAAAGGQPGGILSVSANGTNAGSGIVWASHNLSGNANQAVVPGILRAYNAQNVTNELWNSEQIPARDSVGNLAKFVPPTVANGKVYMATFSNRLNAYGLLPPPPITIGLAGPNVRLSWPTNTFLNYVLQSKTNVMATNWLNMTNGVVISNGAFQVTVPATGTATFYRLKR